MNVGVAERLEAVDAGSLAGAILVSQLATVCRPDVRALHDDRIRVDGGLRRRHAEVRVGGKGLGRTFVVVGLVAAVGFLAERGFDMPLLVQFMPYAMGLILLRRAIRTELLARTAVASGNGK